MPAEAAPLGPIGIALNGVVFYNPSAANGAPTGYARPTDFNFDAGTIASLFGEDDAGGHPQANGQYHYHSAEVGEREPAEPGVPCPALLCVLTCLPATCVGGGVGCARGSRITA